MNGKGDKPRNVGPKFRQNFSEIDWHRDNNTAANTPLEERTPTKRVYRYGPSADHTGGPWKLFVPIPPALCPNLGCVNGGVDTGGVTPWGSGIIDKCPDCNGTGHV
jgi:hypothetical protein